MKRKIRVRLVIHLAQVEGRLCELAEQAFQTALCGGDLSPIEAKLDELDRFLGPDKARQGDRR